MIVLDTHALVWWVNDDERLSSPARRSINRESKLDQGEILISSISAWEIALLVKRNRLTLSMNVDDWLATVADIDRVRFVPVDNEVAVQSVQLPGEFHADPADRIITALARCHAASLVTGDEKIRSYKHVRTIW